MYKSKLTPQEALETIKLRMNYKPDLTLTENKSTIIEQVSSTPEPAKDLTDVDQIKRFQCYLDDNYGAWAVSSKTGKKYSVCNRPEYGYGKFGPNTKKMWYDDKIREDFLNLTYHQDTYYSQSSTTTDPATQTGLDTSTSTIAPPSTPSNTTQPSSSTTAQPAAQTTAQTTAQTATVASTSAASRRKATPETEF